MAGEHNKVINVIFWGMGNTAREKLGKIDKLKSFIRVIGFTSGLNDELTKRRFFSYKILKPEEITDIEIDYICLLSIHEWEIRRFLYEIDVSLLRKVISYHELFMINEFGTSIECGYEILREMIPASHQEVLNRRIVYEKLKRKYAYALFDPGSIEQNGRDICKKDLTPVYVMWLQGFDAAPEIVHICVDSIKKAMTKEYKLILLDRNNYVDYIILPEWMVKKWEKGIIPNAHFSDLIRVRLLNTYGGIWIDSTVYLMEGEIPAEIRGRDFFIYNSQRFRTTFSYDPHIFANWLIKSNANNEFMLNTEKLMWAYWKNEDVLADYSLMHILMRIAFDYKQFIGDKEDIMPMNTATLLLDELNRPFDRNRFEEIRKLSSVQKLNWKIELSDTEDTVWKYIRECR